MTVHNTKSKQRDGLTVLGPPCASNEVVQATLKAIALKAVVNCHTQRQVKKNCFVLTQRTMQMGKQQSDSWCCTRFILKMTNESSYVKNEKRA